MAAPAAAAFPGPAALGRGVVVACGAAAPEGFEDAPRYVLDDAALADPGPLAQALHHHWARRQRFVIEHACDNAALTAREVDERPPWVLGAWFGFERERLKHRVWTNTYDMRSGTAVWWHGELAARRTDATVAPPGSAGDAVLADGRLVWIDAGPRGPVPGLSDAPDTLLVHRESVELLGRATPDADGPLDDDLAPDQHAAATHAAGSARVLAPAGAGKTRVLTARLGHLVRARHVQPSLITAVAYNKRAATELAGRVGDERLSVRTIHSLAYAICRDAGLRTVLDDRAVRGILDGLVRFPKIQNTDPAQSWLDAFSAIRIGLRDPEEVELAIGDVEGLPTIIGEYREQLARRGAVDFDEQICRAIELLCTDVALRDRWRQRCTHLLVDEFQDLAPAYVLLLRLLGWPDLQVFGVGDDDQVIYGHAGADPRYLLRYDLLFPGPADHRLEVNYRCPPDVVAAADTLLGHTRTRVAKTIRPLNGRADTGLAVATVPTTEAATLVLDRIRDLIKDGAAPSDIAVLSRVNASLLPIQVLLQHTGVPSTAPLRETLLQRTGIKSALAYLRIACGPDHIHPGDIHLTAKRPPRGLTGVLRENLNGRGNEWSLDQLEQLGHSLTDDQSLRLSGYVEDLQRLADARRAGADTAGLLRRVRADIGLGASMERLDGSGTLDGSSHGDDLSALEMLAAHHPDPTSFQWWLRDALQHPPDPDGVHLSSIHKVKGEEWPHVIVTPATDGLIPHRLTDDLEEERRVFHVALTRGATSVTVVATKESPSPFVAELARAAVSPGGDPHGDLDALARSELPTPATAEPLGDGTRATPGLRVRCAGVVDVVIEQVQPADHIAVGRVVQRDTPTGARVRLTLTGHPAHPATTVIIDGRTTRLTVTKPRPSPSVRPATGTSTGGLFEVGLAPHSDAAAVEPIYDALRTWRTERASTNGAPPYTVFDNKTLRAIAERQPRDEQELRNVRGIGPAKLEQYGDEVLGIVADVR
jgi:DNA helicase-2/ATP-dependent DNA helicase PcrA